MVLLTESGFLFLLRWIHFLAGITWIGLLYYLNFAQTPFFAETDAPVRSGASGLRENPGSAGRVDASRGGVVERRGPC
jgi:uncharacterized membrane protein